jgi:hypothetical protein
MTTKFTRQLLIIIKVADQQAANIAATQLDDGGAGQFTFTVPLNATGSPDDAPTHYWCSAAMREDQFQIVEYMKAKIFPDAVVVEYDGDDEPNRPDEVLKELGLQRISVSL